MDRRKFLKIGLKVLCVLPFIKPLMGSASPKVEKLPEIRKLDDGRKFSYAVFKPREGCVRIDYLGRRSRWMNNHWIPEYKYSLVQKGKIIPQW